MTFRDPTGYELLARRLISTADPKVHARHSFDDYHARGLLYLNLLRTPDLTCKLYVFKRGWGALNDDGLVVNPHSHAYAFSSTVLLGGMEHVRFGESGTKLNGWYAAPYRTPMNGGNGFGAFSPIGLHEAKRERLIAGDTYHLTADEVHSIVVPTDRTTLLFLVQGHDTRAATDYFARSPEPPRVEGLYQSISDERYAAEMNAVRDMLELR